MSWLGAQPLRQVPQRQHDAAAEHADHEVDNGGQRGRKYRTQRTLAQRVGRGVEHRMLARLGEIAADRGASIVRVPYVRTAKNEPARNFLREVADAHAEPARNTCGARNIAMFVMKPP